jgi:hypothetical protein
VFSCRARRVTAYRVTARGGRGARGGWVAVHRATA